MNFVILILQAASAYTHFEGVIHRLYAFFEKHQKQTFYILLQKYQFKSIRLDENRYIKFVELFLAVIFSVE